MKRLVILISGRGSNMQALVEAGLRGGEIVAVISNRPDAAGLAWAAERGLATAVVDHTSYPSREAFDAALGDAIAGYAPDWIVMAGFMRRLTDGFVERFAGRMLNIHPSLLPAFPGLNTHQRALDAGCAIAGCSVHWVTAELDAGPILAQAAVAVHDADDADTLAARVLRAEHQLYPATLQALLDGRIGLDGRRGDGASRAILNGAAGLND